MATFNGRVKYLTDTFRTQKGENVYYLTFCIKCCPLLVYNSLCHFCIIWEEIMRDNFHSNCHSLHLPRCLPGVTLKLDQLIESN